MRLSNPTKSLSLLRATAAAAFCLWVSRGVTAHVEAVRPGPPQQVLPGLYEAVEAATVFADSKTFADAIPKQRIDVILRDYHRQQPRSKAALTEFVAAHFASPSAAEPVAPASGNTPIVAHIDGLWNALTRAADADIGRRSSLLPLPRPYVVPGGRFREMYYWDSYFTMLGLKQSGRLDLAEDMVENFAYLIDEFGHVPNGTRTYYLSRSQPPFFFEMVALLPANPDSAVIRYLPQLRREYAYWMRGSQGLAPDRATRRVVAMPDGSILNRYWDDLDRPRDESFREDVQLARQARREPHRLYRDVRAAAESGWDFSSRWLADPRRLSTIVTTQIVPVDLNSLLFGLELAIGSGCAQLHDEACRAEFEQRAHDRRAAMDRYLWDEKSGVYLDFRWTLASKYSADDRGNTISPVRRSVLAGGRRPTWHAAWSVDCSNRAGSLHRASTPASSGTPPMDGRLSNGLPSMDCGSTVIRRLPPRSRAAGCEASIGCIARAANSLKSTTSWMSAAAAAAANIPRKTDLDGPTASCVNSSRSIRRPVRRLRPTAAAWPRRPRSRA